MYDAMEPSWDEVPEVGRTPAIPVYRLLGLHSTWGNVSREYRPGRLLCDHLGMQSLIDNDPQGTIDSLGPGDCLWVPLYRGSANIDKTGGGSNARSVDEKLPQFRRNLEFAIEASKVVRGILVGNAGMESWMFDPDLRPQMGEWMAEFIREVTAELRSCGVEPIFSYAEPYRDCYTDRWVVRDAIVELGVVQFCAMVYEGFTQDWGIKEDIPFAGFREYLSGGHFWGGMNYIEGLEARNDEFLAYLGFEAGVMGHV